MGNSGPHAEDAGRPLLDQLAAVEDEFAPPGFGIKHIHLLGAMEDAGIQLGASDRAHLRGIALKLTGAELQVLISALGRANPDGTD
jgi:hypothetical protein